MNPGCLRLAKLSFAIAAILLVASCEKKYVAVAPLEAASPPAPPVPTARFTASPARVRPGEAVRLEWSTRYATYVSIYPVGEVDFRGTRSVVPSGSTVYTLTALGPGGTYRSTLEVTVMEEPPAAQPAPAPAPQPEPSVGELFERNVKDVYFDYNRSEIRPADTEILKANADFLAAHPSLKIIIGAHCDERGSKDYNMALASKRAKHVRDELEKLGIHSDRMKTVVYGKEKPFCTGSGEQCLQENRRVHFEIDQ
jgi:peptidoglycan-associated lipoprotein